MNATRIFALARRIVQQFRRDHRTLALLFLAPVLLLGLLAILLRVTSAPPLVGVVSPGGVVGATIAEGLAQSDALELRTLDSAAAGDSALQAGTIDALLLLPDLDLGQLAGGEAIVLEVHVRGDDAAETSRAMVAIGAALREAGAAMPRSGPQMSLNVVSLYGGGELEQLDLFAPGAIAFFLFFFVFLLTCVSFLRERVNGTLERLLQSPITRVEIVLGYMLGFGVFALLQGIVVLLFTIYGLQAYNAGNLLLVFLIEMLLVAGAVNLGIYLSTFARTELQVVQFIPLVITPQALLSGLIWPVESLPTVLRAIARVLPLTYATSALRAIMLRGEGLAAVSSELLVLLLFAALMVLLSALTMRREVA